MNEKPLVGISTCLLGENVRYDGGHKLDRYLRDVLGKYVEFVPVCPEVECGLSIPREALRLVDMGGDIRLMTQKTKQDVTPQMDQWMRGKLAELSALPLCGFIFKSRSPSSGLLRVRVYKDGGGVTRNGVGHFARGLTEAFPYLPVEEDGRLNDSKLRENFIERVFVVQRWNEMNQDRKSLKRIMDFHAQHKLLLMAHSQNTVRELGAFIADGKARPLQEVYDQYFRRFIAALARIATVKKNTNVLLHVMGYFKRDLTRDEKEELTEIIDSYHQGLVPLIVPITLLNHYVRKYQPEYLQRQVYLNPHPMELMLRNHV
jgi:uncharacterized protein YbgA (DUF1722 family)/uncharacterized protein YbbK (DUF523 family)